jgi:hypothetical protein
LDEVRIHAPEVCVESAEQRGLTSEHSLTMVRILGGANTTRNGRGMPYEPGTPPAIST